MSDLSLPNTSSIRPTKCTIFIHSIYLLSFSYLYLVGVIKEVFDSARMHGMEHLKMSDFRVYLKYYVQQ